MRFGYHVSVSGRPASAIRNGLEDGCECIQFFPSSPRQWKPHPATEEESLEFREAAIDADMSPVILHSIYLVNMAAPDPAMYSRSTAALTAALEKAEALGAEAVVTHTGNPGGESEEWAMKRIADAVEVALSTTEEPVLLLETTAGSGSSIGHTFEQLGRILEAAGRPARLGVCLDTSHVFAAGYDLRTRDGLNATLEEVDRYVGLERLKLLHLNDSKSALGSRVDRHEHIGEGEIGVEGFSGIVNHPKLKHLPAICELPHGPDQPRDLELLRSLT